MIKQGDCLEAMAGMEEGSVDLIYADPPFNTGREWVGESGSFDDRFESAADYVEWMRPRAEGMWRICAGNLYLHCDDFACHHLRLLLDEVCGERACRAQIVWKRSQAQNQAKAKWGRVVDYILHYARPGAVFNAQLVKHRDEHFRIHKWHDDGDGRLYRKTGIMEARGDNPKGKFDWKGIPHPPGGWRVDEAGMQALHDAGQLVYPDKEGGRLSCRHYLNEGRVVPNLWTDVGGMNGNMREREGYPTQKPLALLERIVSAGSNEGDLVFDPFMGSGTTLVAAKRLGRRFMGCDVSADAVRVARMRLDEEEETLI